MENAAFEFLNLMQGPKPEPVKPAMATPAPAPVKAVEPEPVPEPAAPVAAKKPTPRKPTPRKRDLWRQNPGCYDGGWCLSLASHGLLDAHLANDPKDEPDADPETLASDAIASFCGAPCELLGVGKTTMHALTHVSLPKGLKLRELAALAPKIAKTMGAAGVTVLPGPEFGTATIATPRKLHASPTFLNATAGWWNGPVGESTGLWTLVGVKTKTVGAETIDVPVYADLASAPHTLVSGTTGSGKSSLLTTMAASVLARYGESVRVYAIDTKRVTFASSLSRFGNFRRVALSVAEAITMLKTLVRVMEGRYRMLEAANLKSIDPITAKWIADGNDASTSPCPRIVVFADEIADIMLSNKHLAAEFENLVCRLAQLGRAAGIHLVLATQKPIAKVITSLIKGNIPARIAMRTTTATESRVAMDECGAEKLKGRGHAIIRGVTTSTPVDFPAEGYIAQWSKEDWHAHLAEEWETSQASIEFQAAWIDDKMLADLNLKGPETHGWAFPEITMAAHLPKQARADFLARNIPEEDHSKEED